MLGISIYFKDFDENYLIQAAKLGVKYVFTSLHIPEEDLSHLDDKIKTLLEVAKKYDMVVMPDISPMTFEKLNIKNNDYQALSELGFSLVRLDYGLDDMSIIKEVIKYFHISLNASVIDEAYLCLLRDHNIDFSRLIATHNFYPHAHTGLSEEQFDEKNTLFKKWGIRVQAFVPGDVVRRYPLFEGLPTIEKHRGWTTYASAIDLLSKQVDDVIVGDSQTAIETLSCLKEVIEQNTVTLRVFLNHHKHLLDTPFGIRRDSPSDFIRLATPRLKDIRVSFNGDRPIGSITMDNHLYGRYGGEIRISLKPLPADARVNVIGYVHPEDLSILQHLTADKKIKLIAK